MSQNMFAYSFVSEHSKNFFLFIENFFDVLRGGGGGKLKQPTVNKTKISSLKENFQTKSFTKNMVEQLIKLVCRHPQQVKIFAFSSGSYSRTKKKHFCYYYFFYWGMGEGGCGINWPYDYFKFK